MYVLGAALPFGLASEDRIDLWVIDLDLDEHWMAGLKAVLEPHEAARSAALRSNLLQTRFIAAHAAVRHILGRYLDLPPEEVPLDRASSGKPALADSPVSFSLSHSEGLAVCAVTLGGNLGVDIEEIRPLQDAIDLARDQFSAAELSALMDVPEASQSLAFLHAWTRKEAFIKATGEGLRRPLDSFEVSIGTDTASLVRPPADATGSWWLKGFEPRQGFIGTVALDRAIERVTHSEWHPGLPLWMNGERLGQTTWR